MSHFPATAAPPSPATGTATPSTTAYSASQMSGTTMITEALPNEEQRTNGDAESSKMASDGIDPTLYALNLSSYIFNVGYMGQQWADVQITFFDQAVKLHRIILARSPYLARAMLNYQPGHSISLTFADENITPESIHIALQHLYQPALHLVNPDNSRAVLATAFLFQGMPELVHHAYTTCRDSLSHDRILDYVQWLEHTPPSAPPPYRASPSTMFGSVSVHDGMATVPSTESEAWKEEGYGGYGEWSVRLKHDVLDFLIHTLPECQLETSQSISTDPLLLSIYTRLPFDTFKICVESPEFPIKSTQNRFAFAKKAIAQRKKQATAVQMEEIVVLTADSKEGAVHITRKPRKARAALWKVEG